MSCPRSAGGRRQRDSSLCREGKSTCAPHPIEMAALGVQQASLGWGGVGGAYEPQDCTGPAQLPLLGSGKNATLGLKSHSAAHLLLFDIEPAGLVWTTAKQQQAGWGAISKARWAWPNYPYWSPEVAGLRLCNLGAQIPSCSPPATF